MYQAKSFNSIKELNGISERTMTQHFQLYQGYVKKFNEIEEALKEADRASANQVFSQWRALKIEQSFALGGIKNHEIYFDQLGGNVGEPKGKIAQEIKNEFGSFENFVNDFTATAMSARGWTHLIFDKDLNRLLITAGDTQNTYAYWNVLPLMACDVYEHAYFLDYGVKRADYLKAYFNNLDWERVERAYQSLS